MGGDSTPVGEGLRELLRFLAEDVGGGEPCTSVETVLARLQGLLHLRQAGLHLFSDDFGTLHPALSWPRPGTFRPAQGGASLSWFITHGSRRGVIVLRGPDDLPENAGAERAWLAEQAPSAAVLLPLCRRGSLAGMLVLALQTGEMPGWLDEARPHLLRLAGRLGDLAPQLTPLSQRRAPVAILCRLPAAAEALGDCADAETVYRVAVEEAGHTLGAHHVRLYIRQGDAFIDARLADAAGNQAPPPEHDAPEGDLRPPRTWLESLPAGGAGWTLLESPDAPSQTSGWTALTAITAENSPAPRALLANGPSAPGQPIDGPQQEMMVRYAALVARALERCDRLQHRGRTEATSRRNERLESMVGMAGVLAHDLNNLLMPVIGYSKMIADNANEKSELRTETLEILRAAEEVSGLASRLLAVGRRRMRQLGVSDLSRLVAERRAALAEALGESIQLHIKTIEGLPMVQADPDTLFDMLYNLLLNAHEALEEGGEVHIRAETCQVEASFCDAHVQLRPGTYVRIIVEDNGPGMSPEVAAHAFDPFFTTRRRRGAGLGLPTVYGAVRQCGGCIDLQSRLGKGTRIDIMLPPASRETGTETVAASGAPPGGTETVLVVEDEDRVRRVVVHMLESMGYRVFAADNGPEALDVARGLEGPLHLVLTDVVMPGMDGPETVSQLRRLRDDFRTLFMSGYADADLGDPSLDVLRKPFTPQKLGTTIRRLLDS